jgi:hypothetical protein
MYESLKRHSSEDFTLHVLAMDSKCLAVLHEMNLPNVQILPLPAFELEMNLSEVRSNRTHQEWCWTAASQQMEYLLRWLGDGVTYLDADLFFFADPKVMFDELGERSIAIVPHRLIPSKKHLEVNGKFNMGWVTIQNTETGRKCIARWAAQVRERCSATVGCGDQGYLDEWPSLYGSDCCIIENIGANVAPWNLANWRVTEGPMVDGVPVVFFHAHEFVDESRLTNYELRLADIGFIYKRYIAAWRAAGNLIAQAETIISDSQRIMELQGERA